MFCLCALLFLRYAFLFDKAMFVCKKKGGETFELKEIIELQSFQIRDEPTGDKDKKKVPSASFTLCNNLFMCVLHKADLVCLCGNSGPTCSSCWTATANVATIYSSKPGNWRRNGWNSLRWLCESTFPCPVPCGCQQYISLSHLFSVIMLMQHLLLEVVL